MEGSEVASALSSQQIGLTHTNVVSQKALYFVISDHQPQEAGQDRDFWFVRESLSGISLRYRSKPGDRRHQNKHDDAVMEFCCINRI